VTPDSVIMVDWSGGNDAGPKPKKDAIWICEAVRGTPREPVYMRNRSRAEHWLGDRIAGALALGETLLIGFDFPFGYPAGFARALTGSDDQLTLWRWFADRIVDGPKANNRFDIAGEINRRFGGTGPFWANGLKRDIDGLPRTKASYTNPFPERRAVEHLAKGSFACWQMAGAGAVGGQVMMGLPVLDRLRRRFAGQVAVWPFEPLDAPVAFVEIWPSLTLGQPPVDRIKDAWQVEQVASAVSSLSAADLRAQLDVSAPEEGWILGVRATLSPPPLRNDCFALPAGIDWVPVDDALALLRSNLSCVVADATVPLAQASGRVLAQDVVATRSNPPQANSAVDGYGFAGGAPEGVMRLPLLMGRAAAGVPYDGDVPEGAALRILTGAALPRGVDTVVLEEDVTPGADAIAFRGPLRRGANARKAGEDVVVGDVALRAGRVLTPADLALMSAVGQGDVACLAPLRVGILSTGDELVEAGATAGPGQIFDANRPMLCALAQGWGYCAADLGRVADDRDALRAALDRAVDRADVILTSGGASAGDEDHVSALLAEAGALQMWRIAIKPGRPLALGLWRGVPVFGLPGNPVAALVCALVFARPAMSVLAGAGWSEPLGFMVPAAFEKRKKPGRREFLRARIRDGAAQVFGSEGSGRISGLSWAEGLVELSDGAVHVRVGDPVRYVPFGSFGM